MFRFRLERVLRYREQIEEARQRELGVAAAAQSAEEHKLSGLGRNRADAETFYGKTMLAQKYLDVGLMRQFDHFLVGNQMDLFTQKEKIARAKKVADSRRAEAVKAMQKRRVIEILRDRKKTEYDFDQRRREGYMMDEVGITAYHRRTTHESGGETGD